MLMCVISCGLFFSSTSFFASWECWKHKTMNYCNQAAFDILLFCSFHCLCVIYSFFCCFFGCFLQLRERGVCVTNTNLAVQNDRWNARLIFPQLKRNVQNVLHKTTEWLEPQYKSNYMFHNEKFLRCVHEPAFAAKHYERQFKCIKSFHISSVEPNKNVHIYSF